LEFDISFLLGVYFSFFERVPGFTTVIAPCALKGPCLADPERGVPRLIWRYWVPSDWLLMAFGMPEMTLSRCGADRKCRKHRQLDILAFGMPKISGKFF
jgi:hypothetical protein